MEESVFNQSPFSSSPATTNAPRKGRGKKLLFLVIVLLILGAIAFGAVTFLGSNSQEAVPTPTPTLEMLPTDTPTPTVEENTTPTPTKKAGVTSTPTVTPKPTVKPTGTTSGGLDRSAISIAIQNGNGQAGVAKKMSDTLTGLGYTVASTGNADNYDYATTEIHVKAASAKYLTQLKSDLSSSYTIGTAASDYTGSGDALVIVGKE